MTDAKTSTKRASTRKSENVWSDEERAAMEEAARERKAASRRRPGDERADGERDVLAKIAEMAEPDRVMAERIHAIVTAAAPDLVPRTWYGMPAYARDGNVLCYFQDARKFKARYATLGFSDKARLDEGAIWPVMYALTELTPADEAKVTALVKKAVG